MQAVILAAGRGTRMGELTRNRSKAMLPVLGVPLVGRVMDALVVNGVVDFIIVIRSHDEEIRAYVSTPRGLEVNVDWVYQDEPLGMAHALRCAAPRIEGDFILAACDNLVPAGEVGRLLAAWTAEPKVDAVLSLARIAKAEIPRMAVVRMDGPWVNTIVEKPSVEAAPSRIASLPLYGLPRRTLDCLPELPVSPRGEYEIQSAIQLLIDRGARIRGVMLEGRLDLTSAEDLLAVNRLYLQRQGEAYLRVPPEMREHAEFYPPCFIEQHVILGPGCVLGPYVYMESGCHVGARASVREAVLLRGARVPANAQVVNCVIG